jgi:hypothetical protein
MFIGESEIVSRTLLKNSMFGLSFSAITKSANRSQRWAAVDKR